MPNPLINGAYGKARSKKVPVRDGPIEPAIIDQETATVFPYRGIETHGVEPTTKWRDTPNYDQDIPAKFQDQKPEREAIPVIIVSQGAREFRKWSNTFALATSSPQLILSRRPNRVSAKIKNVGACTVLLSPESILAPSVSYPLNPGEEFSTNSEMEVWGIAQTAVNMGGWINLVPSQVINGAVIVTGPTVSTKGYTAARFVLNVTALTGTTPKVRADAVTTDRNGNPSNYTTIGQTTPDITGANGNASSSISPFISDGIQGRISTTPGSGDTVATAEMWGYFTPAIAGDSNQSLLRVYQETTVKE